MAICCICGKETGLRKVMIRDHKYVCYDCTKRAGYNPMTWMGNLKTSEDDVRNRINNSHNEKAVNVHDEQVGHGNKADSFDVFNAKQVKQLDTDIVVNKEFFADSKKRMFYVTIDPLRMQFSPIISFDNILSFELLEDDTPVSGGGLGTSIAGGLLAGPVGAVVGASIGPKKTNYRCTSLKIKITVNNLDNPVIYVDCLGMFKSDKNTNSYKRAFDDAQRIMSILQIMTDDKNKQTDITPANEMEKYKQLYESGAITNDEYTEIKKKLIEKI